MGCHGLCCTNNMLLVLYLSTTQPAQANCKYVMKAIKFEMLEQRIQQTNQNAMCGLGYQVFIYELTLMNELSYMLILIKASMHPALTTWATCLQLSHHPLQ